MMMAKMLGLTPEKLATMAKGFVETVNKIDERLNNIEKRVNFIYENMPVKQEEENSD